MNQRNRLPSLALSIGLVAAIIGLSETVPSAEDKYEPIASSGSTGERVTTKGFGVTVHKITLAETIVVKEPLQKPKKLPTPGMWMVIEATGVSLDQPTTLRSINLHTAGGYVYEATQPLDAGSTLLDVSLQPMLPQRAPILIEVDPAHLVGGKLFLNPRYNMKLNAQVRVDLELSKKDVDRLVEQAHRRYVFQESS